MIDKVTAQLQRDVDLSAFNTLATPATAAYYFKVENVSELIALIKQNNLPTEQWILGGGSNTVFSTNFAGLVWHVAITGIKVINKSEQHIDIEVGAGENWDKFVKYCIQNQWAGLENLSLIPGLVGGAPIQNIGAYGVEVSKYILWVEAVNLETGKISRIKNQDCDFSYRNSVFKSKQFYQKYLITSVAFRLNLQAEFNLSYAGVKEMLSNTAPSLESVSNAICKIRQTKLPDPAEHPNAGSFFKNPIVPEKTANKLLTEWPNMVLYKTKDACKLSAAWLIEQAGFKGKEIDKIRTHTKHALIIINDHKCHGGEVLKFAEKIKQVVKEKFDINLEYEVRITPLQEQ